MSFKRNLDALWSVLGLGFGAAAVNVLASLFERPEGLGSLQPFGGIVAISLLVMWAAAGLVWSGSLLLARVLHVQLRTARVAGGALLLTGVLALPALQSAWRAEGPLWWPVTFGLLAVCVLAVTGVASLGVRELSHRVTLPSAAETSAILVLLTAHALLAVWAHWVGLQTASKSLKVGFAAALMASALVSVVLALRRSPACVYAARTLSLAPLLFCVSGLTLARQLPASSASPSASAKTALTPVILITIDTLRADQLATYNPAATPKPNIEGLLRDSQVFLQARSPAPWTKPSLASMHTGLPPTVHGALTWDGVLPAELHTLAERLSAAGYLTAAIGANTFLVEEMGFGQGFAHYDTFPKPALGSSLGGLILGRLLAPDLYDDTATTRLLTDRAIAWLDVHHSQPFFLWLHYFDPHLPYAPPPEFQPSSGRKSLHDFVWIRCGQSKPSLEERANIRALYDGEARYVDQQLGRVLKRLRQLGLYDRAIIAFSADHGEEFWEHQSFEHGHSLYDELLRVPLAFKVPGRPPARLDATVGTQSVTPTLVELAQAGKLEPELAEQSLAPALLHTTPLSDRPIFASSTLYYDGKEAVILGGHKYIRYLDDSYEESYDLRSDPGEQRPLRPEETPWRAEARAALTAGRSDAGATRGRLGVKENGATTLDPQAMQRLRSLGYVQ